MSNNRYNRLEFSMKRRQMVMITTKIGANSGLHQNFINSCEDLNEFKVDESEASALTTTKAGGLKQGGATLDNSFPGLAGFQF